MMAREQMRSVGYNGMTTIPPINEHESAQLRYNVYNHCKKKRYSIQPSC
jgi:hypothetical protein